MDTLSSLLTGPARPLPFPPEEIIPHASHLTPHILPFPPEEILFEFCAAQTWWLLAVRPPLRRSDT